MGRWRLAYHANCWGPLGGDAVGVTSVSRLTYRTFADMGRAIAEIGAAGYEGVELFDGNVLDYQGRYADLRHILAGAGVRLVAVYSGANFIFDEILTEELSRIVRAADAAAELGAEHFVVGGGARRAEGIRDDDHRKLGAALDRVVELAAARGLRAHFHPHLTTIAESPEQVRKVFAASAIDFCRIRHISRQGEATLRP
jgi:inosose dehydratase